MSKKDKNQVKDQEGDVVTQEASSKETIETKGNEDEKQDEITLLNEQVATEKDRYLRLFADFENYKKRTGRERIELFKTASQEVMVALLPILDDFDRALAEIKKSEDDDHFTGVNLINTKLRETLKLKGLEPIDTKQGETFDAEIHEAITQIPAPDKKLKGKIIDVVERGYTLGDKIIRFPKVVIGQ
ncbi:nucleotide exchange factor GrpE [Rasiella rasia]|uniref:Protein GrpE n=1 Tax=Rasiella rasia TaxID=2744027 RepID=A0A6G6GPU5_9FLAO|nr:nucleotide exchange factor GrpE [Rasiella rasia]QIE60572.1 nucleotide exchange factor GrpE [Rasiella rasia]